MPYLISTFFLGPGFLANCDRMRWAATGGGAGNLVRRDVYDAIGGHRELRRSVVDDIHLALRAKRLGARARVVRAEDRVRVRMYRGFREVCDGFTKNMAYVFGTPMGVLFLPVAGGAVLLGIIPAAVLIAAAAGAGVEPGDVRLAAAGYLLLAAARMLLARALASRSGLPSPTL